MSESLEERFRELAESPLYAEILELDPPHSTATRSLTEILLPLVVSTVILGVTTIAFAGMCAPLGILPLALLAFLYVQILKRPEGAPSNAPLERHPAFVREVRAELTGRDDSQTTKVDTVILDLAGGTRLRVTANRDNLVVSGDFGVAFLQGESLVHFERVTDA